MKTNRMLVIGIIILSLTAGAHAQTNSWLGFGGDGKWEGFGNWSNTNPPSISDSVDLITNAGNNTVTIDFITSSGSPSTLTISNLLLSAPGGSTNTLLLSNAGTTTPLHLRSSFTIQSGGVLIVTNSALLFDANAVCCNDFDINGSVTMTLGSLLRVSNNHTRINLGVGGSGFAGQLTLSNGTVLSREVIVGFSNGSEGTLTVAGGVFSVYGVQLDVGFSGGGGNPSTGTVFVAPNAALITTNASVIVGDFGVGRMTVSTNGLVMARDVVVGKNSGSEGTITIASGLMFISSNLLVGASSNCISVANVADGSELIVTNAAHNAVTEVRYGTLVLTNDGVFTTDSLLITNGHGSFINKGGTFTITGQAQVDQGTQTVASGTTQVSSNMVVGSTANSTGTVNITGGSLVVGNGILAVGNSGTITSGGGVGSVNVSNGALVASTILLGSSAGGRGDLILANGGLIQSVGTNAVLVCNDFGQIGGNLSWTTIGSAMYCGYSHPGAYALSDGAASCQDVYVGYDNAGTMTIAGGAMSILSRLNVGQLDSPMSTGVVWITGGELTMVNDYTIIGNSGVGQMTISNGTVTAATVIVGNGSSGGSLTVAGGVMTMLSGMIVGNCGGAMTGTVTITDGNVFVTNAAHNATLDIRSGRLALNGGQLTADRLVMTNACGRFIRGGGSLLVGSVMLDPDLDADGDGIPNGWEQNHRLDPLNAADAANDNDCDGLSNLREYQLGTDPTDASSPYRITAITREGSNIRVTWTTVGGKINVVQVSPGGTKGNYDASSFNDLSGELIVGGSTVTSTNYVENGGATNPSPRYYRIRVP